MNRVTFLIREYPAFKNPQAFAEIIYNNFIYLKDQPNLQHNMKEITRMLTNKDSTHFLVFNKSNQVIAYLTGEIKHLDDARICYYISYIYVAELYRDKKLGKKMMKLLINKCNMKGIKFILLTTDIKDAKLNGFYKGLGFVPDPLLKNNTTHQVMTLYL